MSLRCTGLQPGRKAPQHFQQFVVRASERRCLKPRPSEALNPFVISLLATGNSKLETGLTGETSETKQTQ